MMRQIGKQILTITALLGVVGTTWLVLAPGASADGLVSTIITDPLTGIAIDGYDPVSYFIGTDPQPGKPDYEFDWGGVPWYFESAANRDIFMRNPDVYAPQFGGHCLMSLSRGYLSDGKPRLYVIDGLKLYFFYSTANRDAFLLAKQAAIDAAGKNWPALSKALSGPEAETPAASALTASDDAASSSSAEPMTADEAATMAAATSNPADAAAAASSSASPAPDDVQPPAASVAPASTDGNVHPN